MTNKAHFWRYLIFYTSYFLLAPAGHIYYPKYQYPILAIVFVAHLLTSIAHASSNTIENKGLDILLASSVTYLTITILVILDKNKLIPDPVFLFYWVGGLIASSAAIVTISTTKKERK